MDPKMPEVQRRSRADARWARLYLALLAGIMLYGLWLSLGLGDFSLTQNAVPDEELYREIVTRVRDGESYYDAAVECLGCTPSVFNFRLPTYAWLLALPPTLTWARWAFLACSLGTTLASLYCLLGKAPLWSLAAAGLWLLGGAFAWCFYSDVFLTTEAWAGMLLVGSLAAYAKDRWIVGGCLGLGALALRELALPYAVVSAFFAWRQRRSSELLFWIAASLAFALALAWHAREIRLRCPAVAASHMTQWLQLPGYVFVLTSARMNVFLWALPAWTAALVLPLAYLGLWKSDIPAGRRVLATVSVYAVCFCIVRGGDYWGLLYSPLLGFGLAGAPAVLRDLLRTAGLLGTSIGSVEGR